MERDWNNILINIKKRGKRKIFVKNLLKSTFILLFAFIFLSIFVDRTKDNLEISRKSNIQNQKNINELKIILITNYIYDDDLGLFIDK
ncbi:MAG TPA: hypothetical protein PKW55_04840 [Spirochaetota bacterium]|nr:hypothetical protein [Spirochaetota bacterium]HOM37722.1 hypothetical protein [Spirochaetota bacterium]HPQ49680.1 hypothetical protein [Spirochaetota bacterium]